MTHRKDQEGCAVLTVGSLALDSVKTPLGKVDEALGGAAVYSAVAASFFSRAMVVGVAGEDFPRQHLEFLESRSIDTQGIQLVPGKSFRWAGRYDYDLNQAHTLRTELNVFSDFHPVIPEAYKDAKYVFLANIDPGLQLEVLGQLRGPKLVICDTMNFWIEGKRDKVIEVLGKSDIAFMNDAEARELCGTTSLVKAADVIRSYGPKVAIIKKGEHGALMFTDHTHFAAPAYPLAEVKDPTGAGDSFAGGFIGYLARTDDLSERNLRKAVVYGSTLASFNVEDFSLERFRRLTYPEIMERYKEFKHISFFEEVDMLDPGHVIFHHA
ncbi:MAG: PfkB family carbohydrate kinase [Armatimonadota bacterium]|nr:PfkB family carbohydrate kinase [Armatimonadota bacterium]